MLNTLERAHGLSPLIGNTPLLAINLELDGRTRIVYAKAEYMNLTGSIKDRMAFHILRKAIRCGRLQPGGLIVEATSGNTGIAFAAIGRALGHPVTIFMPDWMSRERIALIQSHGATIELVSREQGGFSGSIERAEKLVASVPGGFLPRQFSNEDNCEAHYLSTGPEIWWQIRFHGLTPDAFVAGVGTGGTVMGVGRFLKEKQPAIRIHPLEPSNSPTLTLGHKTGKHRIQGISDEFIPPIVHLPELDRVVAVDDGDAILMAQLLARELGLGVGISSGANLLGALQLAEEMGAGAVVTTVFADSNKKYLSTDLSREEPVKSDFMTPRVRLRSFRAFKRVCLTCCDPSACIGDGEGRYISEYDLPPCPRRASSAA